MFAVSFLLVAGLILAPTALAEHIPSNVQSFYDTVKARSECSDKLATGFYSTEGGSDTFSYCGDYLSSDNVIYIQGTGGSLANMDIDCDGTQGGPADDGRCGISTETQSITSFQYVVAGYEKGINDLNANVHPYVVFGNSGTKPGYTTFDPKSYGVQPLSIMAVVCNGKLIYGVWGDENGDDNDHAMVGESSISLATACFGESITGENGHDTSDVLYIAFPGPDAVPGADGANWSASNYDDFESSIQGLGESLVQRIGSTGGSTTTTTKSTARATATTTKATTSTSAAATCSWAGHCAGATCDTYNDCSDDLVCTDGKCA